DGNRLPRLVPRERANRNGRCRGSDVCAEREQSIEPPEELNVPRLRLGDGKLCESRIRIDKNFVWNARVLVAPEPRSAREGNEHAGVAGIGADILGRPAMVAAVVVDERPAVAEAVRLERAVDVGGAVRRIGGARVLHRIVDALAGVLDIEDLMA